MLLVLAAGAALAAGGLFYVNQELGLFGTRAPQAEAMAVDSVPMGERSTDALAMESVEAAPIAAAEPIGTEPSGIGGDGIGLAEAIAPAGRAAQPGRSADVFSGQRDSGREPRREGSVPQSAPAALPIEVGEMASEASPPLRPPTATTLASAEPPPAAPAIVKPSPVWATRFDAKDLADVYPERAARAAIGGKVMLTCTVQPDFAASCRVVAENPTGEGFGAAALRAARRLKAEPVLADGTSSIGAGANVAVTFFPQP
jgi:TonB family protein